MDTLWASLIGLFVIALGVVLTFNLLQGRQSRLRDAWRDKLSGSGRPAPASSPATAPAPAPRAEPGAGGGSRGEPSIGAGHRAGPSGGRPGERVEPTFGPAAESGAGATGDRREDTAFGEDRPGTAERPEPPAPHAVTSEDGEPAWREDLAPPEPPASDTANGPILDPRLDCIVVFGLGAPVAAGRLLAAASTLRRAGSKPIAVEADGGDGRWTVPHASLDAVRRVRAGVLLANRHGPLNAMEFSEFATAMQALGRAIGAGGAIVPDMAPVLEHARQLDEACAQFDAVLGLNVETPTALSPGELAALAAGLGLQERGNNRFTAIGDEGEALFSLALGERAEQLTLLLDVPRSPQDADPWARMVQAAQLCAERTGGRVVDDAGQPMTDSAAAGVARQLAMRYLSLQDAGLDAGSPAALRVFN
jgi:hypothetical protein